MFGQVVCWNFSYNILDVLGIPTNILHSILNLPQFRSSQVEYPQTVTLQPMHRIETSWGLNWLFFSHDSFRAIEINITSLVNFFKKIRAILVGQGVGG